MTEFGPDCFISGTPDVPDPTEEVLLASLSPDELRSEGLDEIKPVEVRIGDLVLKDPNNPEMGFKLL